MTQEENIFDTTIENLSDISEYSDAQYQVIQLKAKVEKIFYECFDKEANWIDADKLKKRLFG